jgi:hypothetical protein
MRDAECGDFMSASIALEEIRRCPSFEGYGVTEDGRLFSFRKRVPQLTPKGVRFTSGLDYSSPVQMKLHQRKSGHMCCSIWNGKVPRITGIHQLLMDAFVGPANGLNALHKNDVPTDNRLSNLRYGTDQDNAEDRVRNGGQRRGEEVPRSKLKQQDVIDIRNAWASGESQKDLAHQYRVATGTIWHIVHRLKWKHVP